ncbi:ArsR/SmtB family transcription factor [Bremerella sp. T1]|uniref:ArsR/SmtB family transcription factor n=1 Tax=Bremerella sp. TYQ1 TaxID=3119568 RepID=UPI001CCDEE67|nr:metalloregulator ArsR/SmtB family transcription factor [Bremerella volcania]UBM35900.1 metalloregulator ArsR/SmtB family transcription factor [Bremerella volcania]
MMFLATPANGHSLSKGYYSDNDSPSHVSEPALAGKAVSPYEALNEDVARQLVQLFKLLADETRLKILSYLLQAGELNVRSLCDLLDQSQPAVSHHLALLKTCGLIESRRDGKNNFYRVIPEQFGRFAEVLFRKVPGLEDDKIDFGEAMVRLETEPQTVAIH